MFLKFEIKEMIDSSVNELKITCVGDGYVGKTCMLWSYVYRKFPKDYVPTVFETHASKKLDFYIISFHNLVSYLITILIIILCYLSILYLNTYFLITNNYNRKMFL